MSEQTDMLLALKLPVRRWRLMLDNMAISDVRHWGDICIERHHKHGYTVMLRREVVEKFVLQPRESFLGLQVRVAEFVHQLS